MPERPEYLRDLDKARRADIQVGRSDAAYGKHTMSRPWQAYNQMQTMQSQANPDLDRLKAVRRDWNRNLKYTPAGMAVSGATTPMDAQNAFMRGTETFRQANPSAYRSMYPISGGIMHLGEKGGLLGTILSEIGKMGKKKEGIVTNVDDTLNEEKEYVEKTFGPTNVHPGTSFYYDRPDDLEDFEDDPEEVYGGPRPHEGMPTFPDIYRGPRPHQGLPPLDVYEGPRPHEGLPLLPVEAGQPPAGAVDVTGDPTRRRDVGYDITASDLDVAPSPNPNIVDMDYWNWVDQFYDTHNPDGTPKADPRVIPGGGTSYVDRFAPIEEEIVEEAPPPIIPYDDPRTEKGIMNAMRAPYTREDYSMPFPPMGPHDPFDPDQQYFENRDEYDAWLRRQRLGP